MTRETDPTLGQMDLLKLRKHPRFKAKLAKLCKELKCPEAAKLVLNGTATLRVGKLAKQSTQAKHERYARFWIKFNNLRDTKSYTRAAVLNRCCAKFRIDNELGERILKGSVPGVADAKHEVLRLREEKTLAFKR